MAQKTNFCPHCEELIIYTAILRHDSHSRPEEQPVNPKYCPLCGTKLELFPGWDKVSNLGY